MTEGQVGGAAGRCLVWENNLNPGADNSVLQDHAYRQAFRMAQMYDFCDAQDPDTSADPVAMLPIQAREFWFNADLPRPTPRIQPGWMLVGKRAYLETGSAMSEDFSFATPVGTVVIRAASDFLVDWGDGTRTGPHSGTGGPWPEGDITHVYQEDAVRSVTVTQTWRANWSVDGGPLAGVGGGLPDIALTETIELPVEQVQAVRNR